VRVRPVAPTTNELEVNEATCMRAGVIPLITPSYLTALAFPVLSTRKACNRGISLVVEGLIKFPIWILAVAKFAVETCSLTDTWVVKTVQLTI
jgi:hypothetical protein